MNENNISGPIFEPGPGWGAHTKRWLGKYFWKVVVPVLLVLVVVLALARRGGESPLVGSPTPSGNSQSINQSVQPGDSHTLIARRALANYLQKFPDAALTAGQKVFIENRLAQTITVASFRVGTAIEFKLSDLQFALSAAHSLTRSELQKWEAYARGVRF